MTDRFAYYVKMAERYGVYLSFAIPEIFSRIQLHNFAQLILFAWGIAFWKWKL